MSSPHLFPGGAPRHSPGAPSIYNAEDTAILYEAATLPIEDFRAESIAIADLHEHEINQHTTLVIPPVKTLKLDDTDYSTNSNLCNS